MTSKQGFKHRAVKHTHLMNTKDTVPMPFDTPDQAQQVAGNGPVNFPENTTPDGFTSNS